MRSIRIRSAGAKSRGALRSRRGSAAARGTIQSRRRRSVARPARGRVQACAGATRTRAPRRKSVWSRSRCCIHRCARSCSLAAPQNNFEDRELAALFVELCGTGETHFALEGWIGGAALTAESRSAERARGGRADGRRDAGARACEGLCQRAERAPPARTRSDRVKARPRISQGPDHEDDAAAAAQAVIFEARARRARRWRRGLNKCSVSEALNSAGQNC